MNRDGDACYITIATFPLPKPITDVEEDEF